MIDRVQGYYGFTRIPFGRDLAPSMLHQHHSHKEAAARIAWCINHRAIGVFTGEVGAGKTVAVKGAVSSLDPARFTVIYQPNPEAGMRGLYDLIVTSLGGTPKYHFAALAAQASAALAAEVDERGRTPALVLDESHLLDHQRLDAIRMLTNYDMDSTTPFAVLLVGQPTLRKKMKHGVLAALEQRIAVSYQLPTMTKDETASYVKHHLTIAGRSDVLFSDDAIDLIHSTSRGLPRSVNNIAWQSLIAAFTEQKSIVDESSARAAVTETVATE
ncbi:ExeA family protein [Streptomyces violascens]|uniref:ATPase AAA n=1 Tax=Streptomyces violascens TaxID=67381 RepID=A0ABQ3QRM8_9ACTN|nr:AAA family ATPase [Streptomyces violascens]GGU48320.1 ATPase AAA [Streptomyces violascens]GHI39919.1 ATPase AAA [Streptomyces violascens]